jgi:hypothetical protein
MGYAIDDDPITWDTENIKYLMQVEIEPVEFYRYGIISRFCSKYSEIVSSVTIEPKDVL